MNTQSFALDMYASLTPIDCKPISIPQNCLEHVMGIIYTLQDDYSQ